MRRQGRSRFKPSPENTLSDRILTALLTPIVLNVALFIVLILFARKGRAYGAVFDFYSSQSFSTLVLVGLPAVIGFVLGSSGTAKLMGHTFWTNSDAEKSVLITAIVWLGIALLIYFSSRLWLS